MKNTNYDLTPVCDGELFDFTPEDLRTDDENMADLYSDPDFVAYMDAREAEAMEHQMAAMAS
jgi:hypothetical protein